MASYAAIASLVKLTPVSYVFSTTSNPYENLIVAGGHAMIGLFLGPIMGKLVSELVRSEPSSIDLTALSVERFR
ncbi:MAG: hypothetical protein MAG451_02903 [Anaerolineales bacterium]|nr:hypothetical protein [Anaerolineales bacterium]